MKNLVVAGVAIAGLVIMFGCLRTMKRCGPYRASVISLSIAAASMLLSQFQVRHFAFLTRPIVCSSVAVVLLAASWLLLPTKPDKHSRTGALRTSTTALVAVAVWLLVIDFSVASGLSGRVVATRLVAVAVVVMLVSLCRSEVARFEFVALGRALLREPDLVNRLASGETDAGVCSHCNRCMAKAANTSDRGGDVRTLCVELPDPGY